MSVGMYTHIYIAENAAPDFFKKANFCFKNYKQSLLPV